MTLGVLTIEFLFERKNRQRKPKIKIGVDDVCGTRSESGCGKNVEISIFQSMPVLFTASFVLNSNASFNLRLNFFSLK